MASSLSYSDFSINDSKNTISKKRKNKTIKKKTKKVENFLNSMENINEDDDNNLANFNPPPQPEITNQPDPVKEHNVESTNDRPVEPEAFSKLDTNESSNLNYQNYYNTYVPYYSKASNDNNIHGSKDDLMKKLNYMIHLLEENKDEKTQNVTEELVLYLFLGVFTIFVVDSFARAGKYTR